jgi:hypothetical protein
MDLHFLCTLIYFYPMHTIEPFYSWREMYRSEDDERSPFYGEEHSEFEYSNTIYNYYIHPQWDFHGSNTLYSKLIYCDYLYNFAILELIGEWNDAITNDVMILKENILDHLIGQGIHKIVLVGENVLNFHVDDDSYYEAINEDLMDEGGWICALNLKDHVADEMRTKRIDHYLFFGDRFNNVNWRTMKPHVLVEMMEDQVIRPSLSEQRQA